jgi:hypothetical protein
MTVHGDLIQSLLTALSAQIAATRNRHTTTSALLDNTDTATRLSREVDGRMNQINMKKYAILSHMYETQKSAAIRRVTRFAVVSVLFTTLACALSLQYVISPMMAMMLCLAWWSVFFVLLVWMYRRHLIRDKLMWSQYVVT